MSCLRWKECFERPPALRSEVIIFGREVRNDVFAWLLRSRGWTRPCSAFLPSHSKKFSKKTHVEIFKANLRLSSAQQNNRLRLRTRVRLVSSVIKMFTDGICRFEGSRLSADAFLSPDRQIFLLFPVFCCSRWHNFSISPPAKRNLRFPISQVTGCSLESPFKWHFFLQFTWTVVITS